MSKLRIEKFECPECGTEVDYQVWDSINVDLDPELKEKLLSGEIYEWVCPNCGKKFSLPYDTLYHDMKHQFMIFYSPFENDDDSKYQPLKIPRQPFGLDENYTIRSVYGHLNLREKITIFEAGLNDVAIERLKYVMKNITFDEWQGDDKYLYFIGVNPDDENHKEFGSFGLYFVDRAKEEGRPIGFDMALYYEALYAVKLDNRMQLNGNPCVDQEWIARQLQRDLFNKPKDPHGKGVRGDYFSEEKIVDGKLVHRHGWALVDADGNPVTEYKYQHVEPAGDGFFRAMPTGSKYVLLWPDGTEVTKEYYHSISDVEDGYFMVSNTVRKTKTTPTKYLCGLANVNGAMLFAPDGDWRMLRPLREEPKEGEDVGKIMDYYAEKDGKPLVLTKFGCIYDPQKEHLPKKASINAPDFIEKFLNWTLPGLQFYYRDTNAPINAEAAYHLGQTLRAGHFVDVTTKLLRPIMQTRYLIASAHAAHLFEMDGMNPNGDKWNLCTFHPNSYFKVMDLYHKGNVTQVLLLHIPEAAARLMTDDKLEFLGNVFPDGKSLVDMARQSLDEKMEDEVHPRSWDDEFCRRTYAPVGVDDNLCPIPLPPIDDIHIPEEYKSLSNLVHEMAQDEDIKGFIDIEDDFPWQGVEKSCCEGCMFSSTIIGRGEGCKMKRKEAFRTQYIKGGLCDEKKKDAADRSLREYRDAMANVERDKDSDAFAKMLALDFIELELDGDIDRLLTYEFKVSPSYDTFPKKVEIKYGKKNDRYPNGVESKHALQAILSLIFSDAWPQMNINAIDKYQYGVDQLHQTFPLMGGVIGIEMEGVQPRFNGLDRWCPSKELQEKVIAFCHRERTLGNMIIWPNGLTYNQITATLTRAKRLWADYPDHFLSQLLLAMTNANGADKGLLGIINDKICKKILANYHTEAAFQYIASELCLRDYLDDNGNVKVIYDMARFDSKDMTKDRLFSAINNYIDTATPIIERRANEMIATLKFKLAKKVKTQQSHKRNGTN